MTIEQYHEQYGNELVMGVDRSIVANYQKDEFTCRKDAVFLHNGVAVALSDWIQQHMKPMLRCEVECNPAFKQIIPYVLVEHKPTGRIYMTTRIGGDERLVGQHSIGLGGHMDAGESIMDCLRRELSEEIGLTKDDIADITFCGFIFKEDNEVNSVHLGMVYYTYTDREDLSCLEADKLSGDWFTVKQMSEARNNGYMESWSALCFDRLLTKEEE